MEETADNLAKVVLHHRLSTKRMCSIRKKFFVGSETSAGEKKAGLH
jgi:hypothetical protein